MNEEESPEKQNLRLALALLDNDESALDEILRLYGPDIIESLYSRFSKRMGALRYEDIEDVVSVALGKLWKARSTYDDTKQSIRVWSYCIAEHVAWTFRSTVGTKPERWKSALNKIVSKKSLNASCQLVPQRRESTARRQRNRLTT